MHRHVRLLLSGLAAAAVLATAIGTASAGRLSFSNSRFRAVWRSFEITNNILEGTIRCPVTLEGSLHSATIRKTVNALIGYVSVAKAANPSCTGGRLTINQEVLPWHVTYKAFTGVLPNITSVTILFVRFSMTKEIGGSTCRGATSATNPFDGILQVGAGGRIEGIRADERFNIPLSGGLCVFASNRIAGTGAFTLLGNTNAVSVTLI